MSFISVAHTPIVGTPGQQVTDLNELVMGLLTYSDGVHTCNLCGKKSPWRTTMLRHVEANHVETAGHVCDICGQVCIYHISSIHPSILPFLAT